MQKPILENFRLPITHRIIILIIFFIFTPITIFASAFSLLSLSNYNKNKSQEVVRLASADIKPQLNVYSSYTPDLPSISADVIASDAREEIIREYLVRYKSPLVPYAGFIVQNADKYGIDYRLITAIAQQESNLCKKIPEGSFNCWGWGINSTSNLKFASYEQGIETVTRGLKTGYIDEGYTTPNKIMAKYTPKSNGSWANGVNKFLNELE